MPAPQADRIRGALLGAALGDALGAPYEFQSRPEVDTTRFHVGHFGTAPGEPTDDTTLMFFLAQSIAAHDDVDSIHAAYAAKLVRWWESGPPDIGGQTLRAARAWKAGHAPTPDNNAQGNGSLMAIAPWALVAASGTTVDAFTNLTHPSAMARQVNNRYVRQLASFVLGYDDPPIPMPLDIDSVNGAQMGWCRIASFLADRAVIAAEQTDPFTALVQVIEMGGDTDTNATIAGAMLGARYGSSWLPPHLLAELELADTLGALVEPLHRNFAKF